MDRVTSPRWVYLLLGLYCCLDWQLTAQAGSPSNDTPSAASAVEMESGPTYEAGTRLHIPKGTASFVVPNGWQAQLPEGSDAIIAVSEAGAGFVMVFMILNVTEKELTALLAARQPITHDLVFEPVGPVIKQGERMTAAYEAGSLFGHALSVMGPNQQGVLYFLGQTRTASDEADQVLQELADSTEFAVTR